MSWCESSTQVEYSIGSMPPYHCFLVWCRYVSMQGELFLAPEAGHKHVYRNTDHVVVFAKEWLQLFWGLDDPELKTCCRVCTDVQSLVSWLGHHSFIGQLYIRYHCSSHAIIIVRCEVFVGVALVCCCVLFSVWQLCVGSAKLASEAARLWTGATFAGGMLSNLLLWLSKHLASEVYYSAVSI